MFWTKNSKIEELCDESYYHEGFESLNKALDFAKKLNEPTEEKYNIFVYWIGENVNYKHSVVLKSFLATQDIEKATLKVYSDKDISQKEVFERYRDFECIEFHIFDVEEEIKGTRYETQFRYVEEIKNHRFNPAYESDFFRILMLYKYGGFYIDFDVLILRDLSPLTRYDFLYQWGSIPNENMINGAIMHLIKGSECNNAMTDVLIRRNAIPGGLHWASDLYLECKSMRDDLVIFPSALFNADWQVHQETFYENDESMKESLLAHSDKPLGQNPDILNSRSYHTSFSQIKKHEYSDFLCEGCFAWHWHNKWEEEIEKGSKFDLYDSILEEKFKSKFEI